MSVLANVWDAVLMVLTIVTGGDHAVKWLEPDRTVQAPCSTAAECQELSKAHTPDVPANTNSEEDK